MIDPEQILEKIDGKTLKNINIVIDGRIFRKCEFISCRFIYMGGQFDLDECGITDCKLLPMGPAAMVLGNDKPETIVAAIKNGVDILASKLHGPPGIFPDGTFRY